MAMMSVFVLLLMSSCAFAVPLSFGSIAENIKEPLNVTAGFIAVGCLVVGVVCLLAAIVKYFEHRRSPLHIPISTVIWLVIIGLLLLILPFAYIITEQGIPLSSLWSGW